MSTFKATSLSTTDISSTNRYGDSGQPGLIPADCIFTFDAPYSSSIKRNPWRNNLLVPLRRCHEFLVYVVLSKNDDAERYHMHLPI